MKFRARIHVMLKADVADVQGIAIQESLRRHGHGVQTVRAGKYFEVDLEAADAAAANAEVAKLADGTFSNPVIERAWFEVVPSEP